jgi:hypothetical protein
MPLGAMLPQITRHWLKDETNKVYNTLLALTAMSLAIFVLLTALLYGPGSVFITHLKDGAHLIGGTTFIIICATYFLEVHHVIHATVYMQRNQVPFVPTALISATSILIIGYFLQGNMKALFATQFIVQLFTNNWYPVYLTLSALHISILMYLKGILTEYPRLRFLRILRTNIN